MPFALTYVLDRPDPSETFIRREIDRLRCQEWFVEVCYIHGKVNPLRYIWGRCPRELRGRFLAAAFGRVLRALPRSPRVAWRIFRHLPQAADLVSKVIDGRSLLIHAHFAGITADLAAVASDTTGIPWSCSVHAQDIFTVSEEEIFRCLEAANGVTACSRMAMQRVEEAGIPSSRIAMIHHGLHLTDFPFDTILPDGVFFTACRLEEKKGVDLLIKACALLKERGSHFVCMIAGEGPMGDSLRKLSKRLGIEDVVRFIGWQSQEETRSLLMDATILVLASKRTANGDCEGISNIILEAMALGTPILTTTAGAAPEIVEDSVNGWLVPPDDPLALADRMELALEAKDQLLVMAKNARKTAERLFDDHRNIRELGTFFQHIVDEVSDAPDGIEA